MEMAPSSVTSPNIGPGLSQPPQNGTSSTSSLASDFQTFLKMLTAQARNQDPLKPIDATEYAAQLAQFAMVEQQVKTNEALAALTDPMSDLNRAGLAGWIGLEVRTTTGTPFSGTPIPLNVTPVAGADQAILVIRDSLGNEIAREDIAPTARDFDWAGLQPDGTPYPPDTYTFSVEYLSGGQSIGVRIAETAAHVKEARLVDGTVMLRLADGRTIPASTVIAVREAAGGTPLSGSAAGASHEAIPPVTEAGSANARDDQSAQLFDR